MHQERNGTLLYPQSLNADPRPLFRKTFTISVKIPLITMEEWREISSIPHITDKEYKDTEADAMTQLAEQKAKEFYL